MAVQSAYYCCGSNEYNTRLKIEVAVTLACNHVSPNSPEPSVPLALEYKECVRPGFHRVRAR